MAIFRNRLPSRRETALVFAVCAFPVYVWCILNLLREVPAWVLRLDIWDLTGVVSYALAFALLESLLILFVLILIAVVLPGRLFKEHIVALSSMIVFVTSGWAIAAHYNSDIVRLWRLKEFALWFVVYLVSIGVPYVLIHRYKRLEGLVNSLADRLAVLSFLYIGVGLLGVVIVILRNILGSLR